MRKVQMYNIDLADNNLSGTLPGSWAGFNQASQVQLSNT